MVYKEDASQVAQHKSAVGRNDSSASADDFAPVTHAVASAGGAGDASNVRRRIVTGPSRYMPAVGEWVHKFKWSFDKEKPKGFTTLTKNLQQWEVSADFRTSDNCGASIALTIEFCVSDIEKVLLVADPIASMRSALQADLAVLGPKLKGHDLMGHVDSDFVNEGTFSHMKAAATGAGITVEKIVFRGFQPSPELRKNMEKAAHAESQRRDAAVEAEVRRQLQRDELEIREQRAAAEQTIADAEFANKQRQADHKIALLQQEAEHERSMAKARREDVLALLTSLRELGLDLTKYLCKDEKETPGMLPSPFDVRLAVAQALQLEGIGKGRQG